MNERVLIVEDDEAMRFFLAQALTKEGYGIEEAGSGEEALRKARRVPFDLSIIDVKLPDISGIDLVSQLKNIDPPSLTIIMTAFDSKELAMEAIQRGAYDYFTKPFKLEELRVVIRRALEKRRLEKDVAQLKERLQERYEFTNIIGNSGSMQEVFSVIRKIVNTDSTILISGESGTGKELIAQAIHTNSKRHDKPFIKLNCVAIPESLLESELFGHEKGAFTGAIEKKPGKFELANGGTIFLDEIGDMTLATQAKILRVLQEREWERGGGTNSVRVDGRVIAATNKDLAQAIQSKEFREDLYYRLNVVSIQLPPLRERKEDIPLLVEHFLAKFNARFGKAVKGVTKEVMELLHRYPWPGNVRELENSLERAVIMAHNDLITPDLLPLQFQSPEEIISVPTSFKDLKLTPPLKETLLDMEKKMVLEALKEAHGVQARAAKILGLSERSLWHLVKKHGIKTNSIE